MARVLASGLLGWKQVPACEERADRLEWSLRPLAAASWEDDEEQEEDDDAEEAYEGAELEMELRDLRPTASSGSTAALPAAVGAILGLSLIIACSLLYWSAPHIWIGLLTPSAAGMRSATLLEGRSTAVYLMLTNFPTLCLDVEGIRLSGENTEPHTRRPEVTDCFEGDDPEGVDTFLIPGSGQIVAHVKDREGDEAEDTWLHPHSSGHTESTDALNGPIRWNKHPDYCLAGPGVPVDSAMSDRRLKKDKHLEFVKCYEAEPWTIQWRLPETGTGQISNAAWPEVCIGRNGDVLQQDPCGDSTAINFTILYGGEMPTGTNGTTPRIEMDVATFTLNISGLDFMLLYRDANVSKTVKETISETVAQELPDYLEPDDIKVTWIKGDHVGGFAAGGVLADLSLRADDCEKEITAASLQAKVNKVLYNETTTPWMLRLVKNIKDIGESIKRVSKGRAFVESVVQGETRKDVRSMLLCHVPDVAPASVQKPKEDEKSKSVSRKAGAVLMCMLACGLAMIAFTV